MSYQDNMCYFSWTGWWLTAGYPLCSLTLMLKVVIVTNQILLTEKKNRNTWKFTALTGTFCKCFIVRLRAWINLSRGIFFLIILLSMKPCDIERGHKKKGCVKTLWGFVKRFYSFLEFLWFFWVMIGPSTKNTKLTLTLTLKKVDGCITSLFAVIKCHWKFVVWGGEAVFWLSVLTTKLSSFLLTDS